MWHREMENRHGHGLRERFYRSLRMPRRWDLNTTSNSWNGSFGDNHAGERRVRIAVFRQNEWRQGEAEFCTASPTTPLTIHVLGTPLPPPGRTSGSATPLSRISQRASIFGGFLYLRPITSCSVFLCCPHVTPSLLISQIVYVTHWQPS